MQPLTADDSTEDWEDWTDAPGDPTAIGIFLMMIWVIPPSRHALPLSGTHDTHFHCQARMTSTSTVRHT